MVPRGEATTQQRQAYASSGLAAVALVALRRLALLALGARVAQLAALPLVASETLHTRCTER